MLVEVEGFEGHADLHGNRVPVTTVLVPDAQVGDWILLHAGFAIQRLAADEAKRTWAVLRDLEVALAPAVRGPPRAAPHARTGAPP